MGATLSYLGYASNQHLHTPSHRHVFQQQYQYYRPFLILSDSDTASPSIIDLYTRLITLERDLQISQAGNTHKEIVIQYLLQINASTSCFQENLQLKAQLLVLGTTIDRTNRENEEIKDKLRKAEDTIALSTSSVPALEPLPISTTLNSYTISPVKGDAVTEDLIDLLGCGSESGDVKSIEEDTTLHDEFSEDESDVEGKSTKDTPEQVLHQSSDLEFQEPSYIVHFADSHDERKLGDNVKNILVSREISDIVTPPSELGTNVGSLEKFGSSSLGNSWSLKPSVSASSSSISSANTNPSLHIVDTNFLDKDFTQSPPSASKEDKEESLERCVALVGEAADTLPSFDSHDQIGASTRTPSKLRELPEKVNASEIEPRWRISETFKSSRERGNAAYVNRLNGGPNELRYPDLFKYGVRFDPPDGDRDVYRTIIVSGLSPDISLGTVLNRVRGGAVVDGKLLDTVNITGKKSALITFLHEYAAMAFEEYTKNNPITINNVAAQVRVVSQPTWPMRVQLRKAIFDHHHTRCLKVINFPEQITAQRFRADLNICMDIRMNPDRVTYMQKGKDGSLELQFSSIDWAGHAYGMLSSYRAYRDCTPLFAPDPCAQPVETLQGQQMESLTDVQSVDDDTTVPDADPTAMDHSGRLAKVEWQSDAERCHGRGFATKSSYT